MRKIKEPRGDDDLVDTDTESENGPVRDTKEVANTINKNITTVIADNRQDKEVNDENIYYNAVAEAQKKLKTVLLLIQKRAVIINLWRKR